MSQTTYRKLQFLTSFKKNTKDLRSVFVHKTNLNMHHLFIRKIMTLFHYCKI